MEKAEAALSYPLRQTTIADPRAEWQQDSRGFISSTDSPDTFNWVSNVPFTDLALFMDLKLIKV